MSLRHRFPARLLLLAFGLFAATLSARADEITISGANTVSFSTPATLSPGTYVPLEGFILQNVDVTVNGTHMNEDVLFFEDGIIIGNNASIVRDGLFYDFNATNQIVNDFSIVADSSSFLGYTAAPIYSGRESSPTLLDGTFTLQDQLGNGDLTLSISSGPANLAPTPEPNSIALLGTGLLGVAGLVKRRFA